MIFLQPFEWKRAKGGFFPFNKIKKNTITKEKKRINSKSEEKERRKKQ